MNAGHDNPETDGVEMPQPTAWPIVFAVGITLLATGLATHLVLSLVGLVLFVFGLGGWIAQLLPGKGHQHELLVEPALRPKTVAGARGKVEMLRPGAPGYRFRLPEKVHPISAGFKGGIVGGLVMPIPAFLYGMLSGHGIWYVINLLAGVVLPLIDDLDEKRLEQFNLTYLVVATFIHALFSVGIGVLYGVLLPTFPQIRGGPVLFGGLVMPLGWTAMSYGFMGVINPALQRHVDWLWFVISQLVFGVAASIVVQRSEKVPTTPAGAGPQPGQERTGAHP